MLATLIIVFREMIEAGLVVGIVLAATRGVLLRGLWVSYGITAGILGACVVALFANSISAALSGFGQELLNVGILTLAVVMLTWHNVWMARHGREIATQMRMVGEQVTAGKRSLMALAIVVAVAVLREGSEIVLFLYSIVVSGGESPLLMFFGGLIGVVLGAGISAVTYFGLLRIPNRHLFSVTSIMLTLVAAGMAAQAIAFMEQAQMITVLHHAVWNSSWLISGSSVIGKALHTLVGYTDQPSQMQLMGYIGTLITIYVLMRLFGQPSEPKGVPAT